MTTDSSRRPDGGPSLERGPRDRKAGPHLLVAERQVLEMIARGDPLPRVLDGLCRLAEGISPGLMALIRLLDREGRHLTNGAAPSLPPAFAALLDGRPSRPIFGPCTRALAERLPVLVADVDTDPRWEAYRSLTAPHGIRSCWSFPIVALDGRPLGTLALFSREPRDLPVMRLNPAVTDLFGFRYEDFQLEGYDPHPAIKAPIAV